MTKNFFKVDSFIGNIGEAVGNWRGNKKTMREYRKLLWILGILCTIILANL